MRTPLKTHILFILLIGAIGVQTFTACDEGTAFKDSRDGKKYETVIIGEQIWMARNLDYNAEGSLCYENDPANCEKYGRLYNWETAKKACPKGWHLPSLEEWEVLRDFAGYFVVGTKLKAKIGWYDNGNGTDDYGFSALPGGLGYSDGSFNNAEFWGNLWSSTESENDRGQGIHWTIYHHSPGMEWYSNNTTNLFCSVRCMKIEAKAAAEAAAAEAAAAKAAAEVAASVKANSFTDTRDGKTYKAVKIGTQIWMAENLNYKAKGSKCYEDSENNCATYGRLYNWETAKKACPSGFHLPTKDEWNSLVTFVESDKGCTDCDATHLKDKSNWWNGETGHKCNGLDSYGFAALPSGEGYGSFSGHEDDILFSTTGRYSRWWSASKDDAYAFFHDMDCKGNVKYKDIQYEGSVKDLYKGSKNGLYSVRCLKD